MTVTIQVELFGVPRLRAGTARLDVAMALEGASLGEALGALARLCPALETSGVVEVMADGRGRARPSYRVSLNGDRFVSSPETPLADGDTLLLLSADVGG
jgi:molybdopterin converting factor small subunit